MSKRKNVDTAERVVAYLRERGYLVGRCDRQLGPCHKEDWPGDGGCKGPGEGFADVLACKVLYTGSFLFVQSCSHKDRASHYKDLTTRCAAAIGKVMACGGQVELWSWWPDKPEPRREVLGYPVTWPQEDKT